GDLEVHAPERKGMRDAEIQRFKAMSRPPGSPGNPAATPAATQPELPPLEMQPIPLSQGQSLVECLMPTDIHPIPWSILAATLVGFVLLVGPVDYFVLGHFRKRVLTWVLFPAGCVLCMVGVLLAASAYLGRHDRTRNVVVIDVGAGNRVLRETRLELVLAGSSRARTADARQSLYCPVDQNWLAAPYYNMRYYGQNRSGGPTTIEGWYPAAYTSTSQLEQWLPSVSRYTRIAPEDVKLPAWNWDNFDLSLWRAEATANRASDVRIRAAEAQRRGLPAPTKPMPSPAGGIRQRYQPDAITHGLVGDDPELAVFTLYGRRGEPEITQLRAPKADLAQSNASFNTYQSYFPWLGPLCARSREGLFCVVSAISPNGAADLEDLSLLDALDPDQLLVVVAQWRGTDMVFYRRLYRLGLGPAEVEAANSAGAPAPEGATPAPTPEPIIEED
ncbi:MAG: hypothetical protein NTW19_23060, partial [Planctomycetota bacterium]|nr:hypothetical protein [Planctomycetota bacterium]